MSNYTLTQAEALWLHNDAAHKGAFGEVDYTTEEHHAGWARMAQANPDGNTTGEHVPGTVDGTNVRVTTSRQEDQRQYNASQSAFVRVPAGPTQVEPFDLVREPVVRERFTVTSEHGSVRPQGAVTVSLADGTTWTTVPQGTHKGYNGDASKASRINGKAVQKGHRAMTNAERKAAHDQRERERKARENGESLEVVEAARAEWLAKRAKRSGQDSADVVASALATSSNGWDANSR